MGFLLSIVACWLIFRVLDGCFRRRVVAADPREAEELRDLFAALDRRATELERLAAVIRDGGGDDGPGARSGPRATHLRVVGGGRS